MVLLLLLFSEFLVVAAFLKRCKPFVLLAVAAATAAVCSHHHQKTTMPNPRSGTLRHVVSEASLVGSPSTRNWYDGLSTREYTRAMPAALKADDLGRQEVFGALNVRVQTNPEFGVRATGCRPT